MALWGNLDASNNAPIFAGTGGLGLTANTQGALFNNISIKVNGFTNLKCCCLSIVYI